MGILIDIIIIALIALSIFLGYKKGLIELSIKLFAFIIAIVITLILYKPVSNFIMDYTTIDDKIQNAILEKANGVMGDTSNSKENGVIQNTTNQVVDDIKNNMLPQQAQNLTINIINLGVMLLLFLITKIALRFVTSIANLLAKLPILKQFNKLGGTLYGAIRGVLIVYVALFAIYLVGSINPENQLNKKVLESNLGKAMYENNLINAFMDK